MMTAIIVINIATITIMINQLSLTYIANSERWVRVLFIAVGGQPSLWPGSPKIPLIMMPSR